MGIGHGLDDCQAESRAGSAPRMIATIESVEYMGEVLFGYAGSGIGDHHLDPLTGCSVPDSRLRSTELERDGRAGIGILHRILHQIAEHSADRNPVTIDLDRLLAFDP